MEAVPLGMAKWESFLENHIEGFFNRRFSSSLEPVELEKALMRELVRCAKDTPDGRVVPNAYTLTVGADDYTRLCSERVLADLHAAVERQVIAENYFMDGTLSIDMKNEGAGKGSLDVTSRFVAADEAAGEKKETTSHTIVLEKTSFARPLNLPRTYELASLTALNGEDRDSYLAIGEQQIYIGRLDKNDFILMDANVSRLHAYVAYERHRHVVHDAESTNGTFVNGKPVQAACLAPGDDIQVGSTVLRYEVIH